MFLRRIATFPLQSCLNQYQNLYFRPVYFNSETTQKSLYRVLNVSTDASPDEIKKNYLALAKRFHPDTAPDDKSLVEKFKEIAEAYRVLSDPKKREQYDIENKIINPQQVIYEKVNPEFKNDDAYTDWMAKKTKEKKVDEDQNLANYFENKYFKHTSGTADPTIEIRSFGEAAGVIPKNLENSSLATKLLYDFRLVIVGGVLVLSLATLGGALYDLNKEKKNVKKMGEFREGKGVIIKLTPFNPV